MKPKTTPFYPRLAPLNQPQIWQHWAGYLSAPRFQYAEINEYYAIRNAAALFDTSPLFKYRLSGADVLTLLDKAMVRDPKRCAVGQAQYTCWCNAAGYVLEDGILLRVAEQEFWLTAVEPNLRYFRQLALGMDVVIEDISADYGILALQGPHSITILRQLSDVLPENPFDLVNTTIGKCPVTVSRTGFTGDLGVEIWVPTAHALAVFDALMAVGQNYGITPLGETALMFARIEAGLLLIKVDFHNARHAWVDAQRETPLELGWGWMLRGLARRDFVGKAAISAERANQTSRWTTVGLEVDWHAYEHVYRAAGIPAPKAGVMTQSTMSVYRRSDMPWEYAGYATSFCYSSLLKKHIAIAKLPHDLATVGSEVDLEIPVIHQPQTVLARVVDLPFYDPPRRTTPSSILLGESA